MKIIGLIGRNGSFQLIDRVSYPFSSNFLKIFIILFFFTFYHCKFRFRPTGARNPSFRCSQLSVASIISENCISYGTLFCIILHLLDVLVQIANKMGL
jgi:hypothetical protein